MSTSLSTISSLSVSFSTFSAFSITCSLSVSSSCCFFLMSKSLSTICSFTSLCSDEDLSPTELFVDINVGSFLSVLVRLAKLILVSFLSKSFIVDTFSCFSSSSFCICTWDSSLIFSFLRRPMSISLRSSLLVRFNARASTVFILPFNVSVLLVNTKFSSFSCMFSFSSSFAFLLRIKLQLDDVLVVVELELPEGDQGKEEDWEKGEEGVRH